MTAADNFTSTAIPDFVCPSCGYRANAASSTTDPESVPGPGDISLCFGCMEVTQFNGDMTQRLLAPEEFMDLPIDLRRHIIQLRAVHAEIMKKKAADSETRPR